MKTLVIHPDDKSTDFLKPIYEGITDKTVIIGGLDVKEVNELIKTHDRVIMLGHGCPDGLFSIGKFTNAFGLVISHETVPLLKEKTDNIYVWCNANEFVERHGLKGYYSGMFISESGEAYFCRIPYEFCKKEFVEISNDSFAQTLGKYVNESSARIGELVSEEYKILAETNPIAKYNLDRLKVAL